MDGIREALTARFRRLQDRSKRGIPIEALPWAERWLMDPTLIHVGSFVWICEQLGFCPDHMRDSALTNAREILK